ncbi:MAG: hypothetical protein R2755_33300 [Acidimicrobiales bacterium]
MEITVVTEGVSILGGTPDGDAGSDDGLRVLDGMNPATFSWIARKTVACCPTFCRPPALRSS